MIPESANAGDFPHPSRPPLHGILPAGIPPSGGLPPRTLQRVREYVEANLENHIHLQALARIAGFSTSHFARAFKESEGVTPHLYIVQRRVRRAQALLARTDLPIAEIAAMSGFSDQSHCTRRFREQVGVNPGNYRRSMR